MAHASAEQVVSDAARDKLMALAQATADGLRSLAIAVDSGRTDDVGGAQCWYSSSYVPLFNGAGLFHERLFNADTLAAIETYFDVGSGRRLPRRSDRH